MLSGFMGGIGSDLNSAKVHKCYKQIPHEVVKTAIVLDMPKN